MWPQDKNIASPSPQLNNNVHGCHLWSYLGKHSHSDNKTLINNLKNDGSQHMLDILWGSEVCFPCVLQVGHLIKFVWFWWSREWDEPLFDDPSNCEIEFYIHSANFFGNLFWENKKSLSFCESLFAVLVDLWTFSQSIWHFYARNVPCFIFLLAYINWLHQI